MTVSFYCNGEAGTRADVFVIICGTVIAWKPYILNRQTGGLAADVYLEVVVFFTQSQDFLP